MNEERAKAGRSEVKVSPGVLYWAWALLTGGCELYYSALITLVHLRLMHPHHHT